MGAEFLEFIARLAWTSSWAIATMLVTRRALRRWCGPSLAYQAWWLVPAATLASAVPLLAPVRQVLAAPALQLSSYASPALAQAGAAWSDSLLAAWTAGALAAAIGFWRAHAGFARSLGALSLHEGVHYSSAGAGPVSFGLVRPRIVVPGDFAERYSRTEQDLILAHERVHVRRGDAWANLLQAALQCVLWFNPLVHLAAGCFRFDQELACDAAVLRAQPQRRRAYADAMLKTQSSLTAAPGGLSCHWHSRHPLKERILTLHQTPPAPVRRLAGRLLVTLLVAGGACAALAARADTTPAANAKTYNIAMTFRVGTHTAAPRVRVREAERFSVAIDNDGVKLAASFAVAAAGQGAVKLDGTVDCGAAGTAHPVLLARLGEASKVTVQEPGAPQCELDMVVSEVPPG